LNYFLSNFEKHKHTDYLGINTDYSDFMTKEDKKDVRSVRVKSEKVSD